MRYINKLNADSFQRAFLTGNAGQRIIMDLRYMPTQEMWMADLTHDDFVLKGVSVLNGLNILRNYHNIIGFGVMCLTEDGQDPRGLTDFDDGYARMYLLSQDEVIALEREVFE